MRALLSHWRPAAVVLVLAVLPAAALADGGSDSFDPQKAPYSPTTPRAAGPATPATPAAQPGMPPVTPERIAKMNKYFMNMYSQALETNDWVTKAFAVISMARIDDPQYTPKLLEVAAKDSLPLVRVYAWEALHARHAALTEEQRKGWLKIGQELHSLGLFRGQLRVGLVGLMRTEGATAENTRRFLDLFYHTNSQDPNDIATLGAMQDTLAEWRSPEIARQLVGEMSNLDNAYRAEYVLQGLASGVAPAVTLVDKGSAAMWAETQAAWTGWLGGANLKAKTEGLGSYTGQSTLMPKGETVNPNDPRWHKDLELGLLHLDQLDVGFAVDSTGSMTEVIRWIQRDVMRLMRACGMLAREPRIGVCFYRDHGDEYVVKTTPLTDRGPDLAKAISGVVAKGGADVPEAVLDGLQALLNQQWSQGPRAKRVVILVGDAMPHKESMGEIQKLVEASAGGGFRFFAVKARTRYGSSDLSSFDQIAAWGKGKAIEVNFYDQTGNVPVGATAIAVAAEEGPYDQVMQEVVASIIPPNFRDRVPYFVKVLMQYVDDVVPEKRKAFGPKPPPAPPVIRHPGDRGPGGGGDRQPPRPPQPPPKPYDPQER